MTDEQELIKLIQSKIPPDTKEYKKVIVLLNKVLDNHFFRGQSSGYLQSSRVYEECQGANY